MLHAAFIRRFREICPEEWQIRVETSLAVPAEQVKTVLGAADDFIVDCKDMDPEIYRHYTGKDSSLMRENLRILLNGAGPERITVRVPLIPEYNSKEDQAHSAGILRSMGFTRLDLFDYVIREQN